MKRPDIELADFSGSRTFVSTRGQPVSLLLPADLKESLDDRLADFDEDLGRYIRFLVRRFRFLNSDSSIPVSHSVFTRYQPAGFCLFKLNFRIDPAIWNALKLLARSRGISMCLAFTSLFEQDIAKSEGVPTKFYGCERIYIMELTETMSLITERDEKSLKIAEKPPPGSGGRAWFYYL